MSSGWKRKTNHDWWDKLDRAAAKHDIRWQWIKGHAGHEVQEIADKAARTIAAAGKVDNDVLNEMVLDLGVQEI